MEVIIVTYTFISFLFLCVGCLFCQCCLIRRSIDIQQSSPAFYVLPSAPPIDYVPLEEEPTPIV